MRIIIDSELEENEKSDCWQVYSEVTDFYQPNIERLRDWISAPKANGSLPAKVLIMTNLRAAHANCNFAPLLDALQLNYALLHGHVFWAIICKMML